MSVAQRSEGGGREEEGGGGGRDCDHIIQWLIDNYILLVC